MNIKRLILLVFIAFLFVFHHFGYIGHYGFDDMQYAELAHNLLEGKVNFDDHFSFRFTIIILTAFSYLIFGINDFASSFPTLIVTSLMLVMIYKLVKSKGPIVLALVLGLSVFSTWFLSYSDKLMPDMYLAACVLFSYYIFNKFRFELDGKKPILYGGLFAFTLFLGFCSKGTVVLILPWLLYLLISDLRRHKEYVFWFSTFIFGLVLLGLYFFSIYQLTGAASQRFDAISANAYLNHCSYDQQSIKILIKRLLIELPTLFMREGMITSYLFVIPFFISNFFKKNENLSEEAIYAINSSIILLLAANFMTISPTSYIPMCLDARHFLYLIPIAAVAASYCIPEVLRKNLSFALFITICFVVISFMFAEGNPKYWKLYGFVLILGVLFRFLSFKKFRLVFVICLLAILFGDIFNLFKYGSNVSYPKQRELIYQEVLSIKDPTYVITNRVQQRIGRYYQEFDSYHPVEFLSYGQFNPDTLKDKPILLLENNHTRSLMFYNVNDLPFYVRYKSERDFEIINNSELGIKLTHLDELIDPTINANSILQSVNDFEKDYPNWNQNNEHLNQEHRISGTKSILCPIYSSTYILKIDSNLINKINHAAFVSANVSVWTADKTDASLVISLENDNNMKRYESIPINKYINSFSNWWPIELESYINKEELKEGDVLKVYIHNRDQNSIYIDDFVVEIKSF